VDKMLALTGETPALQIANIVMPTEAEREERRAIHARLDAIARKFWSANSAGSISEGLTCPPADKLATAPS
jgi:hypothetical protein